jgi:branched-chain amino acid transport system permease protein
MGQAGFVAIGAYVTAIFTSRVGLGPSGDPSWWTSWVSLPLAGIIAGLVGLVFGAPSLRIKGFYLAISTIAAQFIIVWLLIHLTGWTGGPAGVDVASLKIGGMRFNDNHFYWLAMALMVLMIVFTKNIQRTNIGRIFVAIRDKDIVAEVTGINLFKYKLIAFFIGCFFAGIAGWLWANYMTRITPAQFTFTDSIWYLGMLLVGGAGSTTGALMGVVLIRGLDRFIDSLAPIISEAFPAIGLQFTSSASFILFSLVIILFFIFLPRGLYYRWEMIKSRYRTYPYGSF